MAACIINVWGLWGNLTLRVRFLGLEYNPTLLSFLPLLSSVMILLPFFLVFYEQLMYA